MFHLTTFHYIVLLGVINVVEQKWNVMAHGNARVEK